MIWDVYVRGGSRQLKKKVESKRQTGVICGINGSDATLQRAKNWTHEALI